MEGPKENSAEEKEQQEIADRAQNFAHLCLFLHLCRHVVTSPEGFVHDGETSFLVGIDCPGKSAVVHFDDHLDSSTHDSLAHSDVASLHVQKSDP